MATAIVPAARVERQWSTLRLMRTARWLTLLLDALVLIAIAAATETHRAALNTIGKDTAPSIIAAQHIKSAMADMDADAANELLAGPDISSASLDAYENRRVEASAALIAAAENITFGNAERLPIQSIQLGLGRYERLVQKARDLHGVNNAASIAAYREATHVMDSVLLPAADALDQANTEVLERVYRDASLQSTGTRFFLIAFVLGALALLLGTQMMLSRRMHRTFNPALFAATLIIGALALFALHRLARSHDELRIAREQAFASIYDLWRGRASAYEANADESRYLLDTADAPEQQRRFAADADALARLPGTLDETQIAAALRNGRGIDGFSGYLAEEVDNVTFTGEREAAIETLIDWQRYRALDSSIRQFERTGQHKRAVDLCTGLDPGQSDWAFARFDDSLGKTLAINQTAFDHAIQEGRVALGSLDLEAVAAAAAVAALVFAGLAPRLREYR